MNMNHNFVTQLTHDTTAHPHATRLDVSKKEADSFLAWFRKIKKEIAELEAKCKEKQAEHRAMANDLEKTQASYNELLNRLTEYESLVKKLSDGSATNE